MPESKAQQKNRVIYGYGLLLQPLKELAERSQPPSPKECRIAIAKVHAGDAQWRKVVREFATFGSDLVLHRELDSISHNVERALGHLRGLPSRAEQDPDAAREMIAEVLREAEQKFFAHIEEIPVEWEPSILPANTPFTAYVMIRDAVGPVRKRLHYFDRYLKPSFFELFLRGLPRWIELRLATTQVGITSVEAVSKLAAAEFSDYRLLRLGPSSFHDRNLRVDQKVFTLGPGVDRAGLSLTNFGPADSSPAAVEALEKLLRGGDVVHSSP